MPVPVSGSYPDVQTDYYDKYDSFHDYEFQSGLLVLPVMAPADSGITPTIIRMCVPYGKRHSKVTSKKRKTPPPFPAPGVATPSGDTFLYGGLAFATNASGSAINFFEYTAETDYWYIQGLQPSGNTVRGSGDQFQTSRVPYETDGINAALIAAEGLGTNASILANYPLGQGSPYGNPITTSTLTNTNQYPPGGSPASPTPDQYIQNLTGVWLDPTPGSSVSAEATVDLQNYNRLYYDTAFASSLQSTDIIL